MNYRIFLAALLLIAVAPLAHAQEESKYPRVNLARAYVVDADWPKRPAEMKWGEMSGVAVDAHDHVYCFSRGTPPVQVYDASGKLIRAWGKDTLKTAHHIKIDHEGDVWVADIGNHVVEKYTPEGKLLLTVGTKGKLGRDRTHLNMPTDMAISPQGDVFVSDGYGNNRIVHFDKNGKFVKEWGELGHKPGQFSIPHAICMDSRGRLYVADRNNVRVQVFDQDGKFIDEWRDLITPWGFFVSKKDEIWVCGSSPMQWRKEDKVLGCPPKDQIVMRFAPSGKVLGLYTFPKGADGLERPGDLNWVHAIAEDSHGNLYLGDIIGKRAQKFRLVAGEKLARQAPGGLDGAWRVVAAEEEGKKHVMEKGKEILYVFDSGKIELRLNGKVVQQGTYQLDTSKNPKAIDMIGNNETSAAIYKIEHDTLTICAGAFKNDKPVRPTEFATKTNSKSVLFVLERVKR